MGGGPLTVAWRGITTDPESAKCWEAAATDPALDHIPIRPILGYGSYRANAASAGTDSGGGHVDINLVPFTDADRRLVETTFRRYGNAAFWRPARRADGSRYGWQEHMHVLRIDCGDLAPNARVQLRDYFEGWSGLPIGGRTMRDTGSRSYVARRWTDVRTTLKPPTITTGTTTTGPIVGGPITPKPEEDPMAAFTADEIKQYAGSGVLGAKIGRRMLEDKKTPLTVGIALDRLYGQSEAQALQVTALTAAVLALAGDRGGDVVEAVRSEVAKALEGLSVTLTAGARE
jgi:hypothetical protein